MVIQMAFVLIEVEVLINFYLFCGMPMTTIVDIDQQTQALKNIAKKPRNDYSRGI